VEPKPSAKDWQAPVGYTASHLAQPVTETRTDTRHPAVEPKLAFEIVGPTAAHLAGPAARRAEAAPVTAGYAVGSGGHASRGTRGSRSSRGRG